MTNRTEQILKQTRKIPELSQKLLRFVMVWTRGTFRGAQASPVQVRGAQGRPTTSYAGVPYASYASGALTVVMRNSIVDWCVQRIPKGHQHEINMRCLRPIHTKWKTSASSPQAQVVCTCETMARVSKSNSVTTSRD